MSRKCHIKYPHSIQIIGKWKTVIKIRIARGFCLENAALLKEIVYLLKLEGGTEQSNLNPSK